ncbi:MAG TPA: hypothetical protein VNC78_00245 [Actinomycetota bacterium]|nr:hypothetical protein [Actinomycetota bacterium]
MQRASRAIVCILVLAVVAALGPSGAFAHAQKTVFSEDFEGNLGDSWTSGGTHNTWSRVEPPDGNGYLTDSPNGPYPPATDSWAARSSPVDLRSLSACQLNYRMLLDLELNDDDLRIEASGNASTWQMLQSWTGSTGATWQARSTSLGSFSGQQSVYLRFRLVADSSDPQGSDFDGVSLDDVTLVCQEGGPTPTPSGSPSTSPGPSPTTQPVCSPETPCDSDVTGKVRVRRLRITVAGRVDPAHPGLNVVASLSRKKDGRFQLVSRKTVTLDADSAYTAAFAHPKGRVCRIKVTFAGDADHRASAATVRFEC